MSAFTRLWPKRRFAVDPGLRVGVVGTADGLLGVVMKRQAGSKPQFKAAPVFRGPQASESWVEWQKSNAPLGQTSVLLSGEHYRIVPLDAPRVPDEERRAAVSYQAQELLDFPPDTTIIDCLNIPAATSGQAVSRVFAVAGLKAEIAKWMRQYRQAGLNLDAIDIPEMALRNVSALVAGPQTHLYLHVGVRSARLVIVWQGELCAFRRFELSGRQLATETDGGIDLLVERLALDIQRTADAFVRQFHSADLAALWVSSVSKPEPLCAAFRIHQALPVHPLQLEDHLDWQGPGAIADLDRSIDHTLAIGAALRLAA
jgi:MSHA biogenesis protein MshI